MAKVDIGDRVTGAILVTWGDTDKDGEKGMRARIWLDVPFDGTSVPKAVVDTGEMEQIAGVDLPDRLIEVVVWCAKALRQILAWKRS